MGWAAAVPLHPFSKEGLTLIRDQPSPPTLERDSNADTDLSPSHLLHSLDLFASLSNRVLIVTIAFQEKESVHL